MRLFISSTRVDHPPASELIAALRAAGHAVDHSPSGPDDPRWRDWHQSASREAIGRCETFVIVLTDDWNSSTWMAHESELGLERTDGLSRRCCTVYDPDGLWLIAHESPYYGGLELPTDLAQAVGLLTCASCIAFGRDLASDKPRVQFSLGGWGYELAIQSHTALEQQQHHPGRDESEYWLLRCRDCGTWWHAFCSPIFDLRRIEPANVTSVAEWIARIQAFRPLVVFPRGNNVKILLWVLAFFMAIAIQLWLKSR